MLQGRQDNKNIGFIKSGRFVQTQESVFKQDGSRSTDLLTKTLLGQEAATGLWVPYTDITATDGTAVPKGIFNGDDIPFADLVAGNVTNQLVMLLGDACTFDSDELVLENSVTLADVIGTGVTQTTVGAELAKIGFISEATVLISEPEMHRRK